MYPSERRERCEGLEINRDMTSLLVTCRRSQPGVTRGGVHKRLSSGHLGHQCPPPLRAASGAGCCGRTRPRRDAPRRRPRSCCVTVHVHRAEPGAGALCSVHCGRSGVLRTGRGVGSHLPTSRTRRGGLLRGGEGTGRQAVCTAEGGR